MRGPLGSRMNVHEAIRRAEKVLPGNPESDVRGHRLIDLCDYLESDPDPLWAFIARWGTHENEELRKAIGYYLLEHLLSHHFDRIFPRVEQLVGENSLFVDTFLASRKMGQAEAAENEARWDALAERLSR
jgi:hypothetical protein